MKISKLLSSSILYFFTLLLILFNYETKFILRISGFPRLGVLRKFLWKIAFKKIYAVTCPTKNTYNYIKKLNIISDNKLKVLYDPILEINKINNLKKEQNLEKQNIYLLTCMCYVFVWLFCVVYLLSCFIYSSSASS